MKNPRFFDKRFLLVLGILILVLLMVDYNKRMSELTNLNTQLDNLSTEEFQLEQTKQLFNTQIAYATSDVAVQDYARNNGKMAQPGDIPIVPLSPGDSTVQPTVVIPTVVPKVNNWEKWLALFVGE
jgi:cell division protein FtsB